jgi:carbonic anhydrase
MATQIQQNLEEKNKQYASSFKKGHLALPPAKKYAVGAYIYIIRRPQSQ